ncbi:YpjP family protein [Desertibacillus haloalkaliphilus]|uniref:YpjP family protein n=1 Tax=Desertibacillus haloalkaliphilus TaxID=1328930 RepID=UPI001C27FE93|nr:YpjP family protein [Desertibacillus haloalkaliphilus]MBU8907334.1 YpjP family protein [Desertibacillus haloalkaliphilus]
MPLFLRKIIVILVAVFTLGTFVPNDYLKAEESDQNSESSSNSVSNAESRASDTEKADSEKYVQSETPFWADEDPEQLSEQWKAYLREQAQVQAQKKFGPVIQERVGEEYEEKITPKIEKVIEMISNDVDPEALVYVQVSEDPASGLGEKIFHLYDERSGEDLVRFHVRRDQPPKQGYWFNFHYHLQEDNFEQHHDLGKIYWDKNTPPKWMS